MNFKKNLKKKLYRLCNLKNQLEIVGYKFKIFICYVSIEIYSLKRKKNDLIKVFFNRIEKYKFNVL